MLEAAHAHLAACAARRALRAWAAQAALHRRWVAVLQRAARKSTLTRAFYAFRMVTRCAVVTAAVPWLQMPYLQLISCKH